MGTQQTVGESAALVSVKEVSQDSSPTKDPQVVDQQFAGQIKIIATSPAPFKES